MERLILLLSSLFLFFLGGFRDKVNSLTLGRVALGHRSRNARHGIRFTPAQWFFLGFKDRNLEDDYLNDFIIISRRQIILGYSMCILIIVVGWGLSYWFLLNVGYKILLGDEFDLQYTFYLENLVAHVLSLLLFVAGLVGCLLVYKKDRFRNKRMVLHITEGVFLLFIVLMAYDFSRGKFPMLNVEVNGWIINLAFYYLPPFVIFFFKSLPFGQTLEIISLAILVFLVIVPFAAGFYDLGTRLAQYIGVRADFIESRICQVDYQVCEFDLTLTMIWPILVIFIIAVQIVVISYFVDRSNR